MSENNKIDLSLAEVEIAWRENMWQQIKNAALFTIHKKSKKLPDSDWKRRILRAEHSPIRSGRLIINIYNVPSFVITHFVRHHEGIEKYVATLRSDRIDYEEVPNRNTLQDFQIDINFQAFINISRKRKCNCASYETRYVWNLILQAIKEFEPELYKACVRECVYRNGLCPEMFTCNYIHTKQFLKELYEYQQLFDGQVCQKTKIEDYYEK